MAMKVFLTAASIALTSPVISDPVCEADTCMPEQAIKQDSLLQVKSARSAALESIEDPLKNATDVGKDGCNASRRCSECQGDCDDDGDCMPGLKCWQTQTGVMPPGCNTAGFSPRYDWCYKPAAVEWAFDRPAPEEAEDKSDCRDLLLNQIGQSQKLIWASYKPDSATIAKVLNDHPKARGLYDGNYCSTCGQIYGNNENVTSIKLSVYNPASSRKYFVMHHKFALLDYVDSESTGEERVVTGSFNWNDGAASNNYENIFYIKSRPIAEAFYKEYKHVKYQTDEYPGNPGIVVDGDFAVAFDAKCADLLVNRIRQATRNIQVAVWTISPSSETYPNPVYDALREASRGNINVSIITDMHKAEGRDYDPSIHVIKADMYKGGRRRVSSRRRRVGHMHHKFMVVDEEYVVSGSYNFVTKSYAGNNENMVSIRHPEMAKAFKKHWLEMAEKWDEN